MYSKREWGAAQRTRRSSLPCCVPPPPHTHTQCRDEGVCTCHVFLSRSAEWVIPGRKTTHWTPAACPRGFRVPSICSLMGSPYACLWALSASGSRLATQGCPSLGKPHPAAAHLVRPLHIYDRPAAADSACLPKPDGRPPGPSLHDTSYLYRMHLHTYPPHLLWYLPKRQVPQYFVTGHIQGLQVPKAVQVVRL